MPHDYVINLFACVPSNSKERSLEFEGTPLRIYNPDIKSRLDRIVKLKAMVAMRLRTRIRSYGAMHTRSRRPASYKPPVRRQNPPLRIETNPARFHLGTARTQLPNGKWVDLAAVSMQASTIPNAGKGIIVRQLVRRGTKFLEYGGETISLPDAVIRKRQVFTKSQVLIALNPSNLTYILFMQGNHHIKRVNGVYLDSKSNSRRSRAWFARRHLVAGFLNTQPRAQCNCKLVTVGDRVFAEATADILPNTEAFAFYALD